VVRKLTLLQLVAATYFMVAGGPFSLEDVVKNAGYSGAVVALLLVPLVWSVPTGLMIGELASTIPAEGGYYIWVRRAMGPFWGFQEAWLSLSASIFDMAIYPTLFVIYLGRLRGLEDLEKTPEGWAIGAAMIVVCVLINLRGARTVGGSSVAMTMLLLTPFAVFTALALARPSGPAAEGAVTEADTPGFRPDYLAGLLFAMWNYMGWDNASTIAGEVQRPQRTYPRAMLAAMALVTLTYVLPVLAAARTDMAPAVWKTGKWVDAGELVGGRWLGVSIGVVGMIAGLGMFTALVMSYSRVPVVLARDGYLPAVFTRIHLRTGAPWVAIIVCAAAWTLVLPLGLPRILALDVILYGLSLLLEFVALLVLRVREPELARPFRVPGGKLVAALLSLGPALLIGLAIFDQSGKWEVEEDSLIAPAHGLLLAAALVALGPLVYYASATLNKGLRAADAG
jgi:amino acid transporter